MLLLAHAAFPGRFQVATVDHGLRRESAAEAELVAAQCQRLGVAHSTLAVLVGQGNLQDQARRARYDALGAWLRERGLAAILTAHHADDQAETMMMRLNRGSGVRGLAAIRRSGPVGAEGALAVRPLLDWRASELADIVRASGLIPVRDPSNGDPRFDRARMRAALAAADWLDPLAIARSARHLAEAESALEWMVAETWRREVEPDGGGYRWKPAVDAPDYIVTAILERAIARCGGTSAGLGDAARLRAALRDGGKANLAGVLVEARNGVWTIGREPPRRGR